IGDDTYDPIRIAPVAKGTTSYTGTLTTADLTAARGWTLPDKSGTIAMTSDIVGQTYPGVGIAVSTGSGWGTSITDNSTNWNTAYTKRLDSLTTTGSSGAATLLNNVLNIPNYTLAGLGGQPLDSDLTAISTLTGAGFLKRASDNSWSLDTNTYLTSETDPVWTAAAPSYFNLGENENVTGRPSFNGGVSGTSSPFTVDSNTVVTNLNADMLDGQHASAFQAADADLTSIASLAGTTGLLKKTAANTWTLDLTEYLTSASIANLVPYTGATQAINLNDKPISNIATLQTNDSVTIGENTTYDPINIAPSAKGTTSYTGTLTTADLTGNQGWTLPNASGTIALAETIATSYQPLDT
ncbi:MAG TPA: hypothetical protein PLV35_01105, partial [Candidatus Paceibacterota bacterium]|nr:hypothetical protein [Candidatus Paceibacterota bacterium]